MMNTWSYERNLCWTVFYLNLYYSIEEPRVIIPLVEVIFKEKFTKSSIRALIVFLMKPCI